MAYISQYTGIEIDDGIGINLTQNNRLTSLENKDTTLQNNINNLESTLNSQISTLNASLNNLVTEFNNLKPMLRIILRIITTALSATITCTNGTLIKNNNGIWEWEVSTYGNYDISFIENGVTSNYTFEAKHFGINEYKLNYTYQMVVNDFMGKFKNCSENVTGNLYANTAGFTIVGTNTTNTVTGLCRLDYEYDLTHVKYIKFAAKKNVNHGNVGLIISDGVKDSGMVAYYANLIKYGSLGTSWVEYTIDTSNITGKKIISFVGGYDDSSGSSSSSTSFADIRFVY